MDKKEENIDFREVLINNFNQVGSVAKEYLINKKFIEKEEDINIKNVIRYNKDVELIRKDSDGKEKQGFKLYVVEWEYTDSEIQKETSFTQLEFLVEEQVDEEGNIKLNIHTIEDLMQEYDEKSFGNIGELVKKTEENEKLPEEEQDKELRKDSLEELEKEKKQEEKEKSKEEKSQDKNEPIKRKPTRVLETVDTDKAKMDYWQTLKQAFGLPPQVAKLAFAYPISSEDKVDYSNITIYMLDKDGYIINDLDVDHYFEFDSSTGNNPMNDKTVRYEKDENKGQMQLDENNTMARLKAVHPNAQHNTYISIEQINGMGDNRDINVGRQTLHTTDYVEKQVVTDRVRRDFDSEAEKLMKSNAGQYKLKDIYEEAEKHKEHDDGYINILDGDGEIETFNCMPDKDWKELATKWGYYKDGKPDEDKAKEVYTEYKYNNPHLSDEEVVQEVSDDLYEQIPGRNYNR